MNHVIKRLLQIKLFVVLSILLSYSYSYAGDINGDMQDFLALFSEEKMVITPSKYLQPVSQSPSTTTVITSEDIIHSGATTIPDILRMVPGMEVIQTSSPEFNVSIRGDNQLLANKLLVLIDGRTFQEEVQNTVIWSAIPISLEEIDRIEIIRGPGSAMWGANAFDGVVNIITKQPGTMKGTTISAVGGQFGTGIGNLIHEGENNGLAYRLSVGYSRADTLPGREDARFHVEGREQGLDVSRGNAMIEYRLSQKRRVIFSGGKSELPVYDGPRFDDGWGDTDIQYDYLQFNYEGANSQFRAYWNKYDIKIKYLDISAQNDPDNPFPFVVDINSELYNLEWNYRLDLGDSHQIIGGVNYRHNDAGGPFLNPDTRRPLSMTGLFLQEEWRPVKPITVILGARYDRHTIFDNTISPRAAVLYQPVPHNTFRLSSGVAYRSPTPFEKFSYPFDIPKPDLVYEKILTYEAGYSTLLFQRFKGDVSLFYNRLTDLINVEALIDVNEYNFGVYGGEVSGELLINEWLTAFLNYSNQKLDRFNNKRVVRNNPEHKVNGGIHLHFNDALSANLAIHYVSKVKYESRMPSTLEISDTTDAYTLANLQIKYSIWKEKMDIALSVFNLFNDVHREHWFGDEIGTRVLANVTYRI